MRPAAARAERESARDPTRLPAARHSHADTRRRLPDHRGQQSFASTPWQAARRPTWLDRPRRSQQPGRRGRVALVLLGAPRALHRRRGSRPMAAARPTDSKRATSWASVRVPGGDTPIEANIGLLSSAARSLRRRHTWVRGASASQSDSPQAQSPAGSNVTGVAVPRLARLSREDREALAAFGARATWPSGFAVYERVAPADGIFIVLRGQIVLRNRLGAGRSFVPWIATVGETFGGEGLVHNGRYVSDARAEEESETLHLTTSRVSALMREQPAAALALMRQIMAERSELLERFGEHAPLTVEQRLIAALLRLAQSRTQGDGSAVAAVLPRRLLGELVGA